MPGSYLAPEPDLMFIGHFAVGMGAKKFVPRLSLGTLFFAAQFLDLLWPTLLLLGVEIVVIAPGHTRMTPLDFVHYPISHSLLAVLGWSLLFGVVYYLWTRYLKGALVLAALVTSHWILDVIVHIPDLPLWPGATSPFIGLGLWNVPILALIIEGGLLALGVWLYVRARRARNASVSGWFKSLILFLIIIHAMNLFGPPPDNVMAVALVGQLQWLLVIWGWHADRTPLKPAQT